MKKFLILTALIFLTNVSFAEEISQDRISDMKQSGFALYNTNNLDKALEILSDIPDENKDEDVYLVLANIEEDLGRTNSALEYLELAIQKNPKFYKSYYNLGCIYMKKKIFTKAIDNFAIASKLNKENPFIFYNLGCAQMNLGKFKKAKKNFTRAVLIKNDEKNFYYNLAYVNKKLDNQKAAQKIIDFYNKNFTAE